MTLITQCDTISSMLKIVPTPLGNLKDITIRCLEALEECDGIICEDTRRAAILLNHFKIQKPLFVLNDFNEHKNSQNIIQKLKSGQNLCLISDAGTPLVSDPGFKLVRECILEKIEIDSLPGPSSPILALTLSGLPPDKFLFLGYFPDKPGHRQDLYKKILELSQNLKVTFIAFVAPFKILKTISEMKEVFGDIDLVLEKELTKIHQNIYHKKISEHLLFFGKKGIKGEWIMLFNL